MHILSTQKSTFVKLCIIIWTSNLYANIVQHFDIIIRRDMDLSEVCCLGRAEIRQRKESECVATKFSY